MGRLSIRDRVSHRANVWYWRVRYFWFDTENGAWTRAGIIGALVLLSISQMIGAAVNVYTLATTDEPVKAYVWVVQLIIAIIAAIAVYALTPKPETPQAKQQETPNVEDGAHVLEIDGDVWIEGEGEFVLQHMVVGKEAIKSRGKK